MQIGILAGLKRLMVAFAVASLIIAPAGAAGPVTKSEPVSATPQSIGNVSNQVDDRTATAEPILYARTNYAWPFSSGPVYSTVAAESWGSGRGVQ